MNRGRPQKPPEQSKRSSFATRTTPQLRAALKQESERTGRSLSEVAERWMELGRMGERLLRLFDTPGFPDALNDPEFQALLRSYADASPTGRLAMLKTLNNGAS